jgi:hypothetical protein
MPIKEGDTDVLIWGFVRPISLSISGINLFTTTTGHHTIRLPLLLVAYELPARVHEALERGTSTFDMAGIIDHGINIIHLGQRRVRLINLSTGAEAEISADELLDRLAEFEREVRQYMLRREPWLVNDERWGWWFLRNSTD